MAESILCEADQQKVRNITDPISNPQTRQPSIQDFNYGSLPLPSDDSIRLISVNLDPDTKTPNFELIVCSLARAPQYHAVSYVWGSSERTCCLHLSNNQFLWITENLEAAFEYLVPRCSSGYLWIDQLCIDQDNGDEKIQQVPMMGKIYSLACETLIFICPTQPLLGEVIDAYRSYEPGNIVQGFFRDFHKAYIHILDPDGNVNSNVDPRVPRFQAIIQLIENPWFRRAWCLQESIISQRPLLIVGRHSLSLNELAEFFSQIYAATAKYTSLLLTAGLQRLFKTQEMKRERDQSLEQLDLIKILTGIAHLSLASDPRDLIYSFLGLQQDFEIRPDYSLTVEEAFARAASEVCMQAKSLALLGYAERNDDSQGIINLPSWAPDWTLSEGALPLSTLVKAKQQSIFAASDGRSYKVFRQSSLLQLVAFGAIVDEVRECFNPKSSLTIEKQKWAWGNFLEDEYHGETPRDRVCVPNIDDRRLLKILVAEGCLGAKYNRLATGSSDNFYESIESQTLQEFRHDKDKSQGEGRQHDFSLTLLFEIYWVTLHRKLFKGLGDRYGLANLKTEVGDLVCIFHGSDVPVILRKCLGETYKFIGQCYFENCMYGEEVTWNEDDAEKFCLI